MANETLPAVMGTPQNLQKYLFSDDIKKKLEMALPKWLSIDRLLRVVFSSVLRNPKLLECTTESLLSAVMQCAQLGLEPILGRAHFIPYRNNKKKGKPLECQFQPGYQGLVDLAERSGKVETVKAHVVYENDHFEIEYGLNERLVHKPKMDGDRGKPIGAYTVWTRTSGVKTYSFMILDDIYRDFRSKSVAYTYAVRDKRNDTPWIENEPEMLKKSLIKRHQKLEPASVEFMTAVEVDNMAEIGQPTSHPLLTNGRMFDLPEGEEDIDALAKQFDNTVGKLEAINQDHLKVFLAEASKTFSMPEAEIKAEAIKDFDNFMDRFNAKSEEWAKPEPTEKDPIREEYINLMTKGFKPWIMTNLARIRDMDMPHQEAIKVKWQKLYPEATFPLDNKEDAATGEIAVPEGENEGTEEQTEPRTPTGPDPGLTEPPPPSPEDKAIMSLIEGSHLDIANRLCVPCPNQDGRAILFSYCEEGCQERQGCPTFEEYDKR